MILICRRSPSGGPGPRCLDCGDWLLTRYERPGAPLVCPRCGQWWRLWLNTAGEIRAVAPPRGTERRGRG